MQVLPGAIKRAKLLDGIRPFSRPRTAKCRRVRRSCAVSLVRKPDGSVILAGVCCCGNVHSCPACAAAIYAERTEEVKQAIRMWTDSGGFVYMATMTVAHAFGEALKPMREGLAKSWSAMFKGRAGQALVNRIQKRHHIRALEVTHGQNGYHPHIHTLLFLDRELDDDDKRYIAERWKHLVETYLGSAFVPDDEHGCRIEHSHSDSYITKLGLEVSGITKRAKHGNRTMWQVAEDAANGDVESQRIWRDYVEEMLGTRMLCWSQGAKKYFYIGELTDEQLAQQAETKPEEDTGVVTTLATWWGRHWDNMTREPFWYTRLMVAANEGIGAIVELSEQERVRAVPGCVEKKQEPLHPLPWRRQTSKEAFEVDDTARNAAAYAEREAFSRWLVEHGGKPLSLVRPIVAEPSCAQAH